MAVIDTYAITGSSFTGAANREDLLDVVTLISPVDTPLFTMLRKTKVRNVQVEWIVDKLDQAASNAVVEGSSATFVTAGSLRVRLNNYTQISREGYDVSDTQRANNPAGIKDEFRYQMSKALKQLKRDVEHDIIAGSAATGTSAAVRCARGIYFTINQYSSANGVTATATTSNVQEDDLNSTLQKIWVVGGLADWVVCTPTQKNQISTNFAGSANSRRTRPISDRVVTRVVDVYESDFGEVKILPHRWITSAASGSTNIQRATFCLQMDKWLLGFLRPPKNTPLAKIGSSERAMVETEWTLISMHPSANAMVTGHASGASFAANFPSN